MSCVQAMLELSSMVAPRVHVDLRLKGFALEVCHKDCRVGACMHAGAHATPQPQSSVRVLLRVSRIYQEKK